MSDLLLPAVEQLPSDSLSDQNWHDDFLLEELTSEDQFPGIAEMVRRIVAEVDAA